MAKILTLVNYLTNKGLPTDGDWVDTAGVLPNGQGGTYNAGDVIDPETVTLDPFAIGTTLSLDYCHPRKPEAGDNCSQCATHNIPLLECINGGIDTDEAIEICEGETFELTGDTDLSVNDYTLEWFKDNPTGSAFKTANRPTQILSTGTLPSTDVGPAGSSRDYHFVISNDTVIGINLGENDVWFDGSNYLDEIPEGSKQMIHTVTVTVREAGNPGTGGNIYACVSPTA